MPMKKIVIFILFVFFLFNSSLISQQEKPSCIGQKTFISVGRAEEYKPPLKNIKINDIKEIQNTPLDGSSWILLDSVYFNSFIPAGANLGVKINTGSTRGLVFISPFNLCMDAVNAVKKAPKWLRPQLEYTLSRLKAVSQKSYADVINNANDPYIDEIAYSIAYSTPEFLEMDISFPELFVENAKELYSHDSDLKYVDIIDYGNSETDDNYYSTVKYWKIDSNSKKVQVEVPRDIYYMYLVHPKITDEIDTYVNPYFIEYNNDHKTNIDYPPNGVFWRDYLYNHTEQKPDTTGNYFPVLKDSVSVCDVLWDETDSLPQAVKAVNKWINDVMDFTSGTERPHQPVRIYTLHIGRCGEHEDITAAAARACLIPARGIEALSSDHVWNEFWDERWWQWEPVNNSYKNNLCYEKGWGKKFGSITMRRSDGVSVPATEAYSEHPCTINVYAFDSNNQPIDGAVVYLAVKGTLDETTIFIDAYAITDNEGKASFSVSSDRTYYARMNSSLGNFPITDNQVVLLIDKPQVGSEHSYTLKAANHKTIVTPASVPYFDVPQDEYLVKVKFDVESQVIKWNVLFDDLANTNTTFETPGGKVNFYIADDNNYNLGSQNSDFSVIEAQSEKNTYSAEYKFLRWQEFNAWLKNLNCISNSIHASGSFALYCTPALAVEDNIKNNDELLSQNYPNPFDNNTTIKFSLRESSWITLNIFDIRGTLIKCLAKGHYSNGSHSVAWDGKDNDGNSVSNGLYYYNLDNGKEKSVKKIIIFR